MHNSVTNAVHIGSNAFAMFLKSQRKWENPPLQDGHCHQFKGLCSEHGYDATQHILPVRPCVTFSICPAQSDEVAYSGMKAS